MLNSDINEEGEKLGYEWNQVCNEVQKEWLHGQDGDGYVRVTRKRKFESTVLTHIFDTLFASNPFMHEILILDNF